MNAYYNHGRWVVDCPAADCHAALRAPTDECDCKDEMVCDHPQIPCGTRFRTVMPNDAGAIQRLLDKRPSRANRNWYPTETLEDLKAENVTHGVAI